MEMMTPEELYQHSPNLSFIKGYANKLLAFVERKEKELAEVDKKGKSKKTK